MLPCNPSLLPSTVEAPPISPLQCFTMDEKLSKAVTEAFVRLHDQGLIYR